jgi:hypothetical protein
MAIEQNQLTGFRNPGKFNWPAACKKKERLGLITCVWGWY